MKSVLQREFIESPKTFSSSQLDDTTGNLNGHKDTVELVESETETGDVPQSPPISRRTLVVHRLLALLVMVLVLVVGIIVNVILSSVLT